MTNLEIPPSLLSTASNKTILITGSARGIGAATAHLFNSHNANVILVDLPHHERTAKDLIATFPHPDRALFVSANITVWTELASAFKCAVRVFGGLDIVVANAGIMESSPVLGIDVDEEGELKQENESGRVLDVNVKGTLNSEYLFPILQLIQVPGRCRFNRY